MDNYYIPAQMFATNGYIAVSFCPPGCSGELAYRNDHFINGTPDGLSAYGARLTLLQMQWLV
jgi:hypothetical protein